MSQDSEASVSKYSRSFYLMPVVGTDTQGTTYTIENITSNPLKCGFLLAFYKEWNVITDYKLVDDVFFLSEQFMESVPKPLKTLGVYNDDTIVVDDEDKWLSKSVKFEDIKEAVLMIWKRYLSAYAHYQICIPSHVLLNTKKRMENIQRYGKTVFYETLLDPLKTLRVDALPRFLVCKYYKKMMGRLNALYPLPDANELSLALPVSSPCLSWTQEQLSLETFQKMKLADMLNDKIIYTVFLEHCKKLFIEENLYCARAIAIYQSHFYSGTIKTECSELSDEMCWIIFRFFIASNSAYEVSLSYRRKKELILNLGKPDINMFRTVEKSVNRILIGHWNNILQSNLAEAILYKIAQEQNNITKEASCHVACQKAIKSIDVIMAIFRYLSTQFL